MFRVLGFDVGAHWTLPIALLIAGVSYGGVGGVLLSLLIFASIVAHELGHAVVARSKGVPIAGIDLHMFGGVAKMTAPPRSPNDEILIAAAGPAVSFALAGLAFVLSLAVPSPVIFWLMSANLMLGGFNLIPALPMDGGRVLRALLAKRKGFVDGTRIAVKVARVFSVLLGAYAIFAGSFWLVALAVLMWMMGTQELATAARHDMLTRMGVWHPSHTPWARYDIAADRSR